MPSGKSKTNWKQVIKETLTSILDSRADEELTLDEIYSAAVRSKRIDGWLEAYREQAVKRLFSSMLGKSKLSLGDGGEVRAFQSYTKFAQTDDGQEVQLKIWKHIDTMDRRQMMIAAKERVKHIADSVNSVNADVAYWNAKVRKKGQAPIQLDLSFKSGESK